ncbi:hypothetical protein KDA11_04795 [Candidatus Saccharibacteria bacterium]|nr:hypothetical protein [Candidatus Saccharibacteria bacterium]
MATKKAIDQYIAKPSHALLINGASGSGKGNVAEYIASNLLQVNAKILESYPYLLHIIDQPIIIDNVRSAQRFMQLKVPGVNTIKRIVIVENTQTMGIDAQNSFLKLLEEPPKDTVIILTATSSKLLLPTISSRTQKITIQPPSLQSAQKYYGDKYSNASIQKAYYLSEGHVGLMQALLSEDDDHPLVSAINVAKSLLAKDKFYRLSQIDTIAKTNQEQIILKALERICHTALLQSVVKQNQSTIKAWKNRLQLIIDTEDMQKHNPSTKLLLTNLFLNL